MIKKGNLSLVIGLVLLMILFVFLMSVNTVLAVSSVSLKITGTIGDYSSDVRLRTDSNSNTGIDPYDMPVTNPPSDYSSFYSSITSSTLAIDSWNPVERDVVLIYDMPSGQSGNVVFSWNQVTGTNYKAYFTITGAVSRQDMSSSSSYTYSAANDNDIYVTIEIEDYPSQTTPTTTDTGGGGGGGGAAPVVQQPQINIILNLSSDKLLFDAGILITDEFKEIYRGEKMRSVINLQPMGMSPDLDVYLRYYITDKNGKEVDVGDGESETIKITEAKTLDKTFFTNKLSPGEYTLHLELKYESEPGKFLVATASSQFVVLEGERGEVSKISPISQYKLPLIILGVGIFILVILIIFVISFSKREMKKIKNRK